MTFKNNIHPKIQKWYHFASPKNDQIWSHSTCWNYSFKKLVTFEKNERFQNFSCHLPHRIKVLSILHFFLVKTKTNMWMILNKERSTSGEKNCKRDEATWDTFSAIFVLHTWSSKYWAVEKQSMDKPYCKLRSGTLKDAFEANYLHVWTHLGASMLLWCIWML